MEDWGNSVYFVLGFRENSMQSLSTSLFFFGNKNNSKGSIFSHSLIIEFLWFAKLWLKFEEKIHSKAFVNMSREEHYQYQG